MRAPICALTLALIGLCARPGLAQTPAGACADVFRTPDVGEFALVRLNSPNQDVDLRFAVIGAEAVDGVTHFWMEIVANPTGSEERLITQLLVPAYPFDVRDVEGYVLKIPGQPATRMPKSMIMQMGADAGAEMAWQRACAEAVDLGSGTVTVPAGTFDARHFRTRDEDGVDADVWLSRSVPFAVIMMDHPDGKMELVEFGKGATTLLDEEPVEFRMPMGPPDQQ